MNKEPIQQVNGDIRKRENLCPSCGNSYHRGRKCTVCGNVIPREIADPDSSSSYNAQSQPLMGKVWSKKQHKYIGVTLSS